MIIDKSSSKQIDLKTRLYQIVTESKISSLDMMSDMVGTDEEQIRFILEELLDERALEGSFAPDGQRFFLLDVTVSTAPIAPTKDDGYAIEYADTNVPKLVFLVGIVMMIVGLIVRGFVTLNGLMEPIGTAVFMLGIIVMAGGWFMISKANPPSNIK
ncbi:MAG: hypothetical protein ACXACG_07915 [Candidatus Thorarchaeota archaeon]|jgi:hypothetical protein